jgi:hypothetical protein
LAAEPHQEKIMPNASINTEKFHFTKAKPIDLFDRFYAAFGFILTLSLYRACFKTQHSGDAFDDLLILSIAVVPVWGLAYGAWVARQTWSWCLLTLISICSLIALGFHHFGQPEMFAAFQAAGGSCLWWLILTRIKQVRWENQ